MAPAGLEFASNPAPASRCCHHTLLPSPLKVLQMKVVDTGGGGVMCTVQSDLPESGQGDLSLQRKKSKNLGSQVTPVQSYLFNSCGLGTITIERSRYSDEHCNPVPPHPSLKTGFSV